MKKNLLYVFGIVAGVLYFSLLSNADGYKKSNCVEPPIEISQPYPSINKKGAYDIEKRNLEAINNILKYTVTICSGNISRGTGVLVSKDGYILTAAHVISAINKKRVNVRLYDGSIYTADCLGRDEFGDYGLLKIREEDNWEYAEIGFSGGLSRGQACLMVGYPAAFKNIEPATVRIGFYRGMNTNGYLQTSCIMMPGDSGGPLFDLNRKVIGVCSYIDKPVTRNFYAPIDSIKKNWGRLVNGEIFNIIAPNDNSNREGGYEEAPVIQKQFVLEGGKQSLCKIIEDNVKRLRKSVVSITSTIDEKETGCYGAIVSSDGYIVSKSSRVGSVNVYCELNNGKRLNAKVIGRDPINDIVLIKVHKKSLKSINLNNNINNLQVGQLLGTVGINGEVLYSGILGVPPRRIPKIKKYIEKPSGYIGAHFLEKDSFIVVDTAMVGYAARDAGIIAGDKIISLNSTPVMCLNDIFSFLSKTKPGQEITVRIKRKGFEEQEVGVTLGEKPKRTEGIHPANATKVSKRSSGFPNALTHDMPLQLNECGTPVVGLEGKVIAINIARKNRTCSLAIPLPTVKKSIQTILRGAGGNEKK